jgi:hypothetical protein
MFLLNDEDPIALQDRCVCTDCWGMLFVDLRTDTVSCRTPGCPCRAAVSVKSVERKEAESASLLLDAQAALVQASAIPARVTPRRSEAALLAELGF